ncbi:MAG: histidinol-phosphatase [Bacilli bacterium]
MLTSNYHTHTKRCGHASGEDEEYVLEAISYGYRNLGFSDHVMLPGFSQPFMRGEYSEFDGYVKSIRSLAKKYQDRINLFVGFEAEAFPSYFPFFKEQLANGVIDYLILGNHMSMDSEKKINSHFFNITSPAQLYLYRDLALKALSSGLYSIFAHPDFFLASISSFDSDCRKVSRDLIEAAMAYDVPLEVNVAGIRNGKKQVGDTLRWIYPTDDFFSLAGKYHAKCIFGQDAHAPDQLDNDSAIFEAVKFAKKHGLTMVDAMDSIKAH